MREELRTYIAGLERTLADKIQQQRKFLEGQLASLQTFTSNKVAGVTRAMMSGARDGRRQKAKPKYQSKRNKALKWSGRGLMPLWMREEMKGNKLTKDSFLIK